MKKLTRILIFTLGLLLLASTCFAEVIKKTEHFIIDWRGTDVSKEAIVANINYEWYLYNVFLITGISTDKIKAEYVYIYFYESREEFENAWTYGYGGSSDTAKMVMAFYSVNKKHLVFDLNCYAEVILIHEMTHCLLHHYFTQYIPVPLDELIARAAERKFIEMQYISSLKKEDKP